MATETKGKIFSPFIFGIEQEIKKNPNYRPQFSNQHFPHLASPIPNNNNNNNNNNNFIQLGPIEMGTLDSGPIEMGEEPTRVARSVVAGYLLDHFAGSKPSSMPIVSEIMVANMDRYGLISHSEKEGLMKSAGDDSEEDPIEKMILAVEKALLSIEKETGGVSCFLARNLDGKGKNRVYAREIRIDILMKELLPPSLRFHDLNISPAKVSFDNEEYQRQKMERIRQLDASQNWKWIKCKLATTPTPTPTPSQTWNRTRPQGRAKGQQGH